jgi:hypothetical protein
MTRFYAWLLAVEFLVVAAAPVIFTTIESRLLAGMLAGSIFVALGVFIVMIGLQNRAFRKGPTFWAGCLHLFGSALPLLITRLINYSSGFEDVRVLGLPGPVFHKVSTGVFAILMLATVIDLVRSKKRMSSATK